MSFYHNLQKLFSYEYRVETAPQQAIIDELQALRTELRALREDQQEGPKYRTETERNIYEGLLALERREQERAAQGWEN